MLQQLTSILLAFYPLFPYANLTEQTTFSKHITNDWKPNMRKEKYSETLSQCSIFCISDQDLVILDFFTSFSHKTIKKTPKFFSATFLLWMKFQKNVIMGKCLKLWTHYQYRQLILHFLKFTPKFLVWIIRN